MKLWIFGSNKVECKEDLMRDKSGEGGRGWKIGGGVEMLWCNEKGFVINCLFLIPTFLLFVIFFKNCSCLFDCSCCNGDLYRVKDIPLVLIIIHSTVNNRNWMQLLCRDQVVEYTNSYVEANYYHLQALRSK